VLDVSLNSSAVMAETVAEIPIMGSFHGSYSLGAAIGSLIGGVFSSNGWSASIPTLLLFLSPSHLLWTL
jgi:hypothetical protein